MMNRITLHILFAFFPLLMLGQSVQQVNISWPEPMSVKTYNGNQINYFTFEGASNLYEFGALPVYVIDEPAAPEYFGYQVELIPISRDTLPSEQAESLSDIESLTQHPEYRISESESNTLIYILPMYKTATGEVVRLIDFEVIIDLVPVDQKQTDVQTPVSYADESVLNTGTWYKLGIAKTGVHQITYNDLVEYGIDPSQLDLQKIGIFGNYNGMLPEVNSKARIDDLYENAIQIVGNEDGVFNEQDYILFYAQCGTTWQYNMFSGYYDPSKNLYADTAFVFLTTDKGNNKRIQPIQSVAEQPTATVRSFYDYSAHEVDKVNLLHSGREWYGELFSGDTLERTFSFHFPHLITHQPVHMNFEMVARGVINTWAEVFANNTLVIDSAKFSKISSSSSVAASLQNRKVSFFADGDQLDIKVKYYTDDPSARGWLNYIVLNVERSLIFNGGQMKFSNPSIADSGNISRFEIENAGNTVSLWDISNPFNPLSINYGHAGNQLSFTVHTDTNRAFVVFDNTAYHKPLEISPVDNQNLHGISNLNFVIISPEMFLEQAHRLAGIHQAADGLQTEVVTPQQIYNEFSSGTQDIVAIRDFMRMLYKKGAFGDTPAYLLLFGDASFDYRNRVHGNTNIIPTYESVNSRIETKSFATDDFFGLLDDKEGYNCSGNLDVGIGRFPVFTLEDAVTAVDKVEHYMQKSSEVMKPWRNNICYIADDGDGNLHFNQAKYLIATVDTVEPTVNINKIFSDAYAKVKVPGGKRIPEANKKIREQVEKGALIVNYTGHGGLIGWSEEVILDVPTIRSFDNLDNMPLFITATCEFSRFDNPEFISAGEYLFMNKKGGSIALLTTTRLAFAAANIIVNQRIYEHLMDRGDGERPRLGDLVRLSKIPSNENYLNFALLGDPALRLAYPEFNVKTTGINGHEMRIEIDTIQAQSLVTIKGTINGHDGAKLDDFNGYLFPKVFDKPSQYMTLGTESNSQPAPFTLMDKVLFEGKTTVTNGEFEFSFMVPKDISYHYGFGKISYYALDTAQYVDAWGAYEQFFVGGMNNQVEPDNTGPVIELYVNDEQFTTGDVVPANSNLYARLFDENGIYSTGHSLGRDITLTMDEDFANTEIINSYYQPDVDSWQGGEIAYPLNGLPDGMHSLTLKAWDLRNNSSEVTIEFFVDQKAGIRLTNVFNYPNPFSDQTNFGFAHNKNGTVLDVEINIYDINGRLVKQLGSKVESSGSKASPIKWDGRDQNGNPLPTGLYTYHIIVTDFTGQTSLQRQKLIKLND